MSDAPVERGYALCVWSNPEGCWAAIAVSSDRVKIVGLAERLSMFTELEVRLVEAASCEDDDIVEAFCELEPPDDPRFVRPDACR